MDFDKPVSAARPVLSRLADYLKTQQQAVTDQWLLEVRREPAIDSADRFTHQQLLDRLPALFDELCSFLRRRGVADLQDANEQRNYRWQNDCEIGALLRQLDVLRYVLGTVIDRFQSVEDQLKGPANSMAEALVHQFFSEVTVNSVRQFVRKQLALAHGHAGKLEDANIELGRTNTELERALAARQQLIAVLTHDLRNFLQGLAYATKVWNAHGSGGAELAHAQAQVQDIHELLQQLLDPSMTFVMPLPNASPE